jgi:hypothetical protein
MTPLKGGTFDDFTDSMAKAIEDEFLKEYQAATGTALPDSPDRQIFMAAIATGILTYLKAHQNEFIKTITLESSTVQNVTALELNIPES